MIITARERESNFRKDLKDLLEKYTATLDITDDGRPYGMHSAIVTVCLDGSWDSDGNILVEYTEFQL